MLIMRNTIYYLTEIINNKHKKEISVCNKKLLISRKQVVEKNIRCINVNFKQIFFIASDESS